MGEPATNPEAVLREEHLLMSLARAGSANAFEQLYDRYCDRAYRVARSICHDQGRTEDAVQGAFLAVWNCRAAYRRHRGTVAAWLLTTVCHRAIDIARGDNRHTDRRAGAHALEALPAPALFPEQAGACEVAHRLRALLSGLPDAQREVITLAFYGQLTHLEIAEALQLPNGTIKGRMRLGLQKLRTAVEQEAAWR